MKVVMNVPVSWSLKQIISQSDKRTVDYIYDRVFYYRDFYLHLKKRLGKINAIKYMQELIEDSIKKNKTKESATCKKGCNHCCHIQVMVTETEVELIKDRYGKFTDEQIEALEEQSKCDEETRVFAKHRACVFLKDGECSIYDIRPIACRKHFSMEDPNYCDDLKYHAREVHLLASTEVECIASGIINAEKRGNFAELLLRNVRV